MFTANSFLTNSFLSQALPYIYSDKKIPKPLTLSFQIPLAINELQKINKSVSALKIKSHFLLFIVRVYLQKTKIIVHENEPEPVHKKKEKTLKIKPFELIKIDVDRLFDFSFNEIEMRRNDTLESMHNFDMQIEPMHNFDMQIENQMHSTHYHSPGLMSILEPVKKRKIDDVIETENNIVKFRPVKVREEIKNYVNLPKEVISFFNIKRENINMNNISMNNMVENESVGVEVPRDGSVAVFEPVDSTYEPFDIVDEPESILHDFRIEEDCIFNEKVKSLSKFEKGRSFLELLRLCNEKKVNVRQEREYGPIYCEIVY